LNSCPGDHAYPGLVSVGALDRPALLKETGTLKQNIDRNWDERTRKEMEIVAHVRETNRADYRAAKMSWADRLNDGG
jgi:hypothetical protein